MLYIIAVLKEKLKNNFDYWLKKKVKKNKK